jgi:hypothetical protein
MKRPYRKLAGGGKRKRRLVLRSPGIGHALALVCAAPSYG